jgi:hypothetical protein
VADSFSRHGTVGIGTTSPSTKLTVVGNSAIYLDPNAGLGSGSTVEIDRTSSSDYGMAVLFLGIIPPITTLL